MTAQTSPPQLESNRLLFAGTPVLKTCLILAGWIAITLGGSTTRAQECVADSVTVGYRDFAFGGGDVTSAPTEEKPESKLWWHDGLWWAVLWDHDSQRYTIHTFDRANQCWLRVGPEADERPRSSSDALWDGKKLYIASRAKMTHKPEHGPESARLYRYSYDSGTKSYHLDPGFPMQINDSRSRALVLTKDSAGKLWATWVQEDDVMINHTDGDDLSWGTPVVLPVQGNDVDTIDISAVLAFGGDRIGVFWGNQIDKKYYFAVHIDTRLAADWEPREVVLGDGMARFADDHINLASSASSGFVFAVVKTSLVGSERPRILLMKRHPGNRVWTSHVVGLGKDDHTRPIVLFDSENDSLYVFARVKFKNAIYLKSAHMDDPTFSEGIGRPFIQSTTDSDVNNPTSTKQTVSSETGLLVVAGDRLTKFYLHNYLNLRNTPVVVEDRASVGNHPDRFELLRNHPNPFNPTTTIRYTLAAASEVTLTIYNTLGQQVRTLAKGRQPAGAYRVQWDSRDSAGKLVVSGVYLYSLKAGSLVQTRTMVLAR
ncbi:MAG: FlgD immunoglobulin-like domain containing protein [bacterium]